jgi:N-acetyltransferase
MSISPVILTGRHVRLEPLAASHLDGLAQHAGDPELWRYMVHARPNPRDSLQAWFESVSQEPSRGGVAFAVIDLERGAPVGGTTYMDASMPHRRLEIGGTWLGRACWRTAINTECKWLLLRHAFESLEVNRVQLKTDARNVRSQRAIERLGALKEGVTRLHMVMPDGFIRDTVMYSIIAAEWPGVGRRLEERLGRPGAPG